MSRPFQVVRLYAGLSRRAGVLLVIGTLLTFVASALVLRGGMLHPEVYLYLPYHLDEQRALLTRVFDVFHADTGAYSARELSYFFDLLDAHFIAWSIDHGRPHFLSACHYVFCGGAAALMWWFARHRLLHSRAHAALLVAIFLMTPMVFLGGGYFRSAKSGVAVSLLTCACCVAPAFSRKITGVSVAAWLGTFFATLMMGLFDRQGVFLGMLLALVLFVHAVVARDRSRVIWFAAPALALVLLQSYNRAIGPALIAHFEGFRPSFEFQQLPWAELWHSRRAWFDFLFYGPALMLDNLRFLLGSVPVAGAVGLLMAAAWRLGPHWPWPARVEKIWTLAQRKWSGRIMVASLPIALLTMNALMVLRVKAVVGLDFRRVYYGLPSVAVFWIAVACAIAVARRTRLLKTHQTFLLLLVALVCNVLALAEHRQIIRLGLYRESYRMSPDLIAALQHLDQVPVNSTKPPFWPTFASGETTAAQDGIVRFFRRRQLERSGAPSAP
jgi:hypothetical protein